jgi:hypothetical protein
MKILSIVAAAIFLAGCSSMGSDGTSGASGMSGTGVMDGGYRSSTAPFDPNDLHHGG